ncbi:MAG: T9SS type A sorting domain-containing protein [Bacteroidetes bacterium]|nr:T9SS type A sorting domain-containing protein [Bacteroidota bacterium]
MYENPGVYFRSLGFATNQRGWIGTLDPSNVLLETLDGGTTWENITGEIAGDVPTSICGIYVLDYQTIYAVGGINGGSFFLRTLDGGQTWISTLLTNMDDFLVDVHFFDRQRGLAVGGVGEFSVSRAVVLGTEDGGTTWTERFRSSQEGEWGWKLTFPTSSTGYVSVERHDTESDSKVLKTTDGGLTWIELTDPAPPFSMQGIGFVTELVGWLGGRGTQQMTTDGGLTWNPTSDLSDTMNRFHFFSETHGYAVGDRVFQYGSGIVRNEDETPMSPRLWVGAAYPNPFPFRILIPYRLPFPAHVSLELFDVRGRVVATIDNGLRPAGPDELIWDARSPAGQVLPPGVYLYRFHAGNHTVTGRIVRMAWEQ